MKPTIGSAKRYIWRQRWRQVIKYGWRDSKSISETLKSNNCRRCRLFVFSDILYSYARYRIWSNQYSKERFYLLSPSERSLVGARYNAQNKAYDKVCAEKRYKWLFWPWDYQENRRFFAKYGSVKYSKSLHRSIQRRNAYQKRYNMGGHCGIQHDVEITRNHRLFGTISIGNYVMLAKHVFIDYSGEVIIDDHAKLANGVIIETHYRDMEAYERGKDVNVPTKLHICEKAYIGSRAMIMPSCHYIGKHARVGSGAVVTKDVPDYATVVGVPAKVIKVNAPSGQTEAN